MDSTSVPQIQVEDNIPPVMSTEQRTALHRYIDEVIRERPELGPEELGEHLLGKLHTVAALNGLEGDLTAFRAELIKDLHIMLHAQAQNFAQETTKALKEELRTEYKEYLEANKMSGLKKAGLVVGTLAMAGGIYYIGRRNGRAIGQLENV